MSEYFHKPNPLEGDVKVELELFKMQQKQI